MYPSINCESDHHPVIYKLRIKLQKLRNPKQCLKLYICKQAYAVAIKNKYEVLDIEWTTTKKALVKTKEVIPEKERLEKKKYMGKQNYLK